LKEEGCAGKEELKEQEEKTGVKLGKGEKIYGRKVRGKREKIIGSIEEKKEGQERGQ
jgi:hypothetical protein